MDELGSVGVGIALGLLVISFLSLFPGEPFDYTNHCTEKNSAAKPHTQSTPTSTNRSPHEKAIDSTDQQVAKHEQIAEVEQAAQRVKIHKLQELLGMEKAKVQQLIDRAKAEALETVTAPPEPSSTSYSTWLDRSFFAVMLGLLAWVLWTDYRINLLSVFANVLPREAEVLRQVSSAPRQLLSNVFALWD